MVAQCVPRPYCVDAHVLAWPMCTRVVARVACPCARMQDTSLSARLLRCHCIAHSSDGQAIHVAAVDGTLWLTPAFVCVAVSRRVTEL